MLEAVSLMLEFKDTDEQMRTYEKIKCAKIMLDKIIEGMKDKPLKRVIVGGGRTPEEAETNMKEVIPKPKKALPKAGEVEICVDHGIIQSIKNAEEATMIQLDGKAYPWKTAVGMSFTEGKVL